MLTQSTQTQTIEKRRFNLQSPTAVALLLGLIMGRLFTLLWPKLPFLTTLGMWPMGTAIAMILVALASSRLRHDPQWDMAIGGQFLGVAAMGLMLCGLLL